MQCRGESDVQTGGHGHGRQKDCGPRSEAEGRSRLYVQPADPVFSQVKHLKEMRRRRAHDACMRRVEIGKRNGETCGKPRREKELEACPVPAVDASTVLGK